ncbi:hypothetical protein MANY_02450 [Mycolicibacterium anyangense]|uniref:Subtilisin inhibitor domain-containing protein n=2 Tax=Mycolicibacterium anyangense TaxID=1431246 RepID=A0A6N4W2Y9_9MYCO|nr:hypothetical protein MANY_02450 [Mycolicibacterium anyangense]
MLFYDSAMIRPALVMSTLCLTVLGGAVGGGGVAQAGPDAPCTYTLSPPEIADGQVSATAVIAGCGPAAGPYSAVACIQPLDRDSVIQCNQAHGADPATIVVPYRPGTTYVATGRGCAAWALQPASPPCQILGPFTATL